MNLINFTFESTGELKVNEGEPWAVAPMVAVRAMKLNGENLDTDEIAKSVEKWNGVAITIPGHPIRDGKPVSLADAPWFAAGYFNGAHMDGDRLKGNAILPVGHSPSIDAVIEAMRNGKTFDVSTGYFANSQDHDGEKYQRDIEPDHIAILLNEAGACDWQDGCGIPRHNSDCTCQTDLNTEGEPTMNEQEMVPVTNEDEDVQEPIQETEDVAGLIEAAVAPLLARLDELNAKITEHDDAVATVKANTDAHRAELVSTIKAHSSQWTDDDLLGLSIDTLEKIEASTRPASYRGRGAAAPVANADDWEDYDAAE